MVNRKTYAKTDVLCIGLEIAVSIVSFFLFKFMVEAEWIPYSDNMIVAVFFLILGLLIVFLMPFIVLILWNRKLTGDMYNYRTAVLYFFAAVFIMAFLAIVFVNIGLEWVIDLPYLGVFLGYTVLILSVNIGLRRSKKNKALI